VLAYIKGGQEKKAEDALLGAIALDRSQSRWHQSLGDFYQSIEEPDLVAATASYLNAYNISPTRSTLMKLRGVTRTDAQWDYDSMLNLIQQSSMKDGMDPQLAGLYARALGGRGAYDRADAQLRQNYQLYLESIKAEQLPESGMRDWYEDLYVVYANRTPEDGERFAKEIVGGSLGLWDNIGLGTYWALIGQDGFARAIEYQQRALEQVEEGEVSFRTKLLNMLGSYQIADGQSEAACATFKAIIDEDPTDASALNNYAYILGAQLDEPAEALSYAERAIALNPDSLDVLDTIVVLHAMLGDHAKSMVARLRLYALYPENPEIALQISRAYVGDLEDPQRGLDFAKLASKITPKNPAVMDALGWAYYQSGEQSRGEELLRASIKSRPSSLAHLHMAQVLIEQGRDDKARAHLQAGLDLSPDAATSAEIERLQDDIGSS
jgi:tetratricopeptide (TPR) repeat protein